jgi:YegS/Rv2252/BmrU family lipid kinase
VERDVTSTDRPLVIVNPRAGSGRAGRAFDSIRSVLERRLGSVDVSFTERSAHAIDLARAGVLGGKKLVIAVGGDGTLHEVANGVLDAGATASVGYVGQGTGGDFRRTLGIEHRLDAYVEAIAAGCERRVDVGKVSYGVSPGVRHTRWFLNILSVGMGGLVVRYVKSSSIALGGTAAYLFASARALATCRRGRVRCDVRLGAESSQQVIPTFLLAVCNGSYFGGGMFVAPMAKLDDGRFEVISLDAPSKLGLAAVGRYIHRGKHLHLPGVRHFACDDLAIDIENEGARSKFLLEVDGEAFGGLPIGVELVPRALTLRV